MYQCFLSLLRYQLYQCFLSLMSYHSPILEVMLACKTVEIANVKWTARQIITFLELMRKYECLRRPTDKDRKNKQSRDAALENLLLEVQEKVGPSDLDLVTMKSKMKNLRTVYSRELAKVLKAQKDGVTYIPALRWFSVADTFLRHSKEAKEATLSTNDVQVLLKNELNQSSLSDSECEVVTTMDASEDYSGDHVTITFENVEPTNETDNSTFKPNIISCPVSDQSLTGKMENPRNLSNQKCNKRKLENRPIVDNVKSSRTNCDPSDQFYVFGLYVASELRQLSDETQLKLAKNYINSILFDASMSALLPP